MNYTQLHLTLSHLPVLGTIFGILLLAYGLIRNNDEVKKISLGVFVLMAAATLPVYFTGEPAEEIVEDLAGVSETIIEVHEDAALYALILMEVTGVLALLNLILIRRSYGAKLLAVTFACSIIAAGTILWTANLGGKIRHTEIGASSRQTETGEEHGEDSEHEEEDDDEEDDEDHD